MAAYDSGTPTVEDQAKAWVDAVNSATGPSGGWRLQLVRMRTRRKFGKPPCGDDAPTLPAPGGITDANGEPVAFAEHEPDAGECPEAPVRIRRFVSGCPWALVDQAIRYLHRIAPYRGIVYNGVRLEGVYRPTVTQWMRDEQSQSPGERGSLGTYTLVQDLVEVTCCGDEETLGTGDSCQSAEKTTYVWDADSVEPLPTSCEQGVAYALRAVSRGEDGSFSYQLVKSVAKTVAWGPVTISCGPLETVEEWGWRNLYGSPSGGFEIHACGAPEPVYPDSWPTPDIPSCDEAAGVRTEAQWQLNQDCTWDVRVRRRTAKPQDGGWRDGTSCRPASHVVYRSSLEMPDVEPPAPGERVSASFRLNDDMTWDGEVSRVAAPDPLEYGWTEGSACRARAVEVYEDQVDRPVPPAVSSLAPGETLEASVSRTEDCLWNARFVRTAAPDADEMVWNEGSPCQPTETEQYLSQPDYRGLVETDLEEGVSLSQRVTRNADCTYDVAVQRTRPQPWAETREWWSGGTMHRYTRYGNQPGPLVVSDRTSGAQVSNTFQKSDATCLYDGESREVFDPGSGAPGGDYLWGPEFDGQQVDLLTQVSNADPLGKDIVAQWRVSWYVSGSRNLDDFTIDMRRLEADGWDTSRVDKVGSYAYGTGESPSMVFRGRIYKVVCIADGSIRRTDPRFKTLADAVKDAHDKVAASDKARVRGF